jgi:hypothetical protein
MDIDGSGELSRTEVEDAFLGLGIPVTQKVGACVSVQHVYDNHQ